MRRLGVVGAGLAAAISLSGFAAVAALALPEHLSKGSWTGQSDGTGKPSFETRNGFSIVCGKWKGSGKDTTDTLGEFTIAFEECQNPATGIKCNTLGDVAGVILVIGEYHYVYEDLTILAVGLLLLPKELHLECSALMLTLEKAQSANGGQLCPLLEPTSSKAAHLLHCNQEKGVPQARTYWNDAGTEITNVELLCSTDGATFEDCAQLGLSVVTFAESNSWENA